VVHDASGWPGIDWALDDLRPGFVEAAGDDELVTRSMFGAQVGLFSPVLWTSGPTYPSSSTVQSSSGRACSV
jgi:hypothetical protein